jgi:hypothetical protein
MKHPPVQYSDTAAKEMVRMFIRGSEDPEEYNSPGQKDQDGYSGNCEDNIGNIYGPTSK